MKIETINRFEEIRPAFFYIPDISGFTKFINVTKLYESKALVHDLLESIIDSNILNLKVAEILGDAIVFYSVGTPPNITKLESQAKKTFLDFQRALKKIEAENILIDELHHLSLKIIVHYGEIASTEIKGINKLLGSDLILSYRLLKNNIQDSEYLLMTEQYLDTQKREFIDKCFLWSDIREGMVKYDFFGNIYYKYIPFAPLKIELKDVV